MSQATATPAAKIVTEAPGPKSRAVLARKDAVCPDSFSIAVPVVTDHAHGALLTAAGFAMVRYFTEMERPLSGLPRPAPPRGVVVVPFSPELGEAVRLAHNEAFADHWGSEARSPEKWRYFLNHESFRPGLSSVALGGVGGGVRRKKRLIKKEGELRIVGGAGAEGAYPASTCGKARAS